MSKHNKPKKNQASKNQKKTKAQNTPNRDLLGIIDNYFLKKQTQWFWVFFIITAVFTFLLFDLRVSVGGDDSAYIIRAYDLLKDFKYPAFQGPLYPMILSIFVGLFGINLFALKILSAIFVLGHLYFLFIAFKDRIPAAILIASIILMSLNSYLLFYGSQTYSETLFLMAQMLFFVFFFKYFIADNEPLKSNKDIVLRYLSLGGIILGLGLIKSVGFSALFAVLIYFIFVKNWKAAGFSAAGFFATFGIWQLLKFLLWNDKRT